MDARQLVQVFESSLSPLPHLEAMVAFAVHTSSLTASKAAFAGKNVRSAGVARPQVIRKGIPAVSDRQRPSLR